MQPRAVQQAPGAEQCPFRLLIIGGGPAGISILVRAIRIGVSKELLSGDEAAGTAGVCLMEQGAMEQLGGGNLQNYQINSNTHAYKFFTNIVKECPDVVPPERTAGSVLESLLESKNGRALDLLGRRPAPLSHAGKFLCEVAQCVRSEMQNYEASVCMLRTRVTRLQRVNGELWKVYYTKPTSPTHNSTAAAGEQCVFAKHVVLATGGLQRAPQLAYPAHQAKLMLSDHVLSGNGLRDLRNRIAQSPSFRKIVVVGGSHSAFSVAWLCLNRLQTSSGMKDDGVHLGPNSICIVHRKDIQVYYSSAREAELDGYTYFDRTNSQGQVYPFGGLRGDAKELYTAVRKGRENRVRLFKVGDGDDALVSRLYNEATVIVWACGYETRIVPIVDEEGNAIELKYDKGQVDVDEDARILLGGTVDTPVGGLYGVGLGYGLKATLADGTADGASGRADGFAVYLKRAATLVLGSVVGPKVFGQGNNTWQERREALLRRCIAPDSPRLGAFDRDGFDSDVDQDGRPMSPLRRSGPLALSRGSGTPPLLSPDRQQMSLVQRLSRPRRRGSQTEAATESPSKRLEPRARSLPPAGRSVNPSEAVSLRQSVRPRERQQLEAKPSRDASPPPRTAPMPRRRPSHTRPVIQDADEDHVKPAAPPGPLVLTRVRRHYSGSNLTGGVLNSPSSRADPARGSRAPTKHVKSRSVTTLPVAVREHLPLAAGSDARAPPPPEYSSPPLLSPARKEAYKLPKQTVGADAVVGPVSPSLTRRSTSVDRATRAAARRKLQPVATVNSHAANTAATKPVEVVAPSEPSTPTPENAPADVQPAWEPASPIRASLERFPQAVVETIVR